jgi:hypothetical protein
MNKQTSLLLVLGIGGTALYFMLKPKKEKITKSLVTEYKPETPSQLTSEIESATVTPLTEQVVPRFGKPLVLETSNFVSNEKDSFSPFKNYVDVKANSFFKPELGMFHK